MTKKEVMNLLSCFEVKTTINKGIFSSEGWRVNLAKDSA